MAKLSLSAKQVSVVRQVLTTGVSPRVFTLVEQRVEMKAKIAELTEEVKAIDARLLREADKHDGQIKTEDFTVIAVDGTSRSINKEALLQLGVKPSVIAKATVETAYRYARVYAKGEK